jgi:hypothetical protein
MTIDNQTGEMLKRTVIGSFGICGKTAGRELPAAQVVAQTLAAVAFF